MFRAINNFIEDKRLAAITKRDQELGVPTPQNLEERCRTALRFGHWKIVFDCLDKGVIANWNEDAHFTISRRPLHHFIGGRHTTLGYEAILKNRADILKELIARGVSMDGTVRRYSSMESLAPIELAARKNKLDCVLLLIDAGPQKHLLSSALVAAERNNNVKMIKALKAGIATAMMPAATPTTATTTVAVAGKGDILGVFSAASADQRSALLDEIARHFPDEIEAAAEKLQNQKAAARGETTRAVRVLTRPLSIKGTN